MASQLLTFKFKASVLAIWSVPKRLHWVHGHARVRQCERPHHDSRLRWPNTYLRLCRTNNSGYRRGSDGVHQLHIRKSPHQQLKARHTDAGSRCVSKMSVQLRKRRVVSAPSRPGEHLHQRHRRVPLVQLTRDGRVVIRDMQSQIRGGSSAARPVRSSVEQTAVKEHRLTAPNVDFLRLLHGAALSRKRCCCRVVFLAEGVKRTAQHDPV